VLATNLGTYADISVVCGQLERDPDSHTAVTNPTVLVEVLSDSTEAYHRGEKFAHYRRIPSLREYVIVGQSKPLIEVHRKNEAGLWVLVAEAGAGEQATLESIGCVLNVDEVYLDPLAEPS
jgi:Uma2 family endonuclease